MTSRLYSPNNPFNQEQLGNSNSPDSNQHSRINDINSQDIDLVFGSNGSGGGSIQPPLINIEDTLPISSSPGHQQEEEAPPRLPSRPVSPALPPRPNSTLSTTTNNQLTNDIPSPAYTPTASPNESVFINHENRNETIPTLNLSSNDSPPPLPPPPPYSEAPEELQNQIFSLPFSNTGGDVYQRPPQPPPQLQHQQYTRPPGQPPRRRPGGGYPGNAHVTYGNAAYNSNQPPLPPRR